jgi:plasmid stabilization system protein ParE
MEQVSFHRLAQREIDEGVQFYNLESPGLGAAFLDEVERCTQVILQYPEAGQLIIGTIRRRLIRRFPYALLYSIRHNSIRVLAVMNLKRRPMYWVGRA